VIFSVTAEDIFGAWHSPTSCPVAMALRRILGTSNVRVETKTVMIEDRSYDLPQIVYMAVLSYDVYCFFRPLKCKWEEINNG